MKLAVFVPYRPAPGIGLPHSAERWNHGCRDLWCVQAHDTQLAENAQRVPRHGAAGWRKGCRCVTCEFGHEQSEIRIPGKATKG